MVFNGKIRFTKNSYGTYVKNKTSFLIEDAQ